MTYLLGHKVHKVHMLCIFCYDIQFMFCDVEWNVPVSGGCYKSGINWLKGEEPRLL